MAKVKTLFLYLIRHAETQHNLEGKLIGGRSNHVQLTKNGKRQLVALGKRLSKENVKFDYVYTSIALRAITSADIVCNITGYKGEIIKSDDLQELSQGEWEGKKRSTIYTDAMLKKIAADRLNFKAPKGESQLDLEKRMYGFVNSVLISKLNKKDKVTVAIFGHGLAFKCLLRGILKSDSDLTYKISIDNSSITLLRYDIGGSHAGWHILKINDHAHLMDVRYKPNIQT